MGILLVPWLENKVAPGLGIDDDNLALSSACWDDSELPDLGLMEVNDSSIKGIPSPVKNVLMPTVVLLLESIMNSKTHETSGNTTKLAKKWCPMSQTLIHVITAV